MLGLLPSVHKDINKGRVPVNLIVANIDIWRQSELHLHQNRHKAEYLEIPGIVAY